MANEIGIRIIEDLLYYFPYRYVDKTVFHKISEIHADLPYIQSAGIITEFIAEGQPANPRLIAKFTDGTGVLDLIWFKGVKWIRKGVKTGVKYIIFGKPVIYNKRINVAHPEIEELSKYEAKISSPFQGLYNTTEKLKASFITSKTIQNFLQNLFKVLSEIPETLPDFFVEKYSLLPLHEALFQIHFPANAESLKKARYRLKFEELFFIQLNLLLQKNLRNARYKGFVFEKIGDFFNTFYKKNLSFELTEAQKRVTKEIRIDVKSGRQMNRLLQGDVGSGKTLVALMTMLMAADNGFQSCIMAPTEILAQQHYQTITRFLEGIEINVHLLTGSTTKKQRTIIHDDLLTGKNNILIGTHALIEENVQFRNLGLVIIDEQHRFGVAQRAKLQVKNENPPHVLVMTATPIPRTLAMTLYGDLDVSVIDELPPGRKPIKTIHFFDSKRLLMFGFLKEQIRKGRQTYIVYPLISESE
ncbi:MAG: ATP-dependent DNA helicase RecG, partial [Bacteroidia bacterium]|nr:ATP-dependent DNA helicase RecG [Bacteroidia bacterium]